MSPKPRVQTSMEKDLNPLQSRTAIAEMAFSPIHPPRHLFARVLHVTWRECPETRRLAVSRKPRVQMSTEKALSPLQSQTKIAEMGSSPIHPHRHLFARVLYVTWRECPRTRRLAVSPKRAVVARMDP